MRLPVSLVWMSVYNPPEGMEDWSYYRQEVGGHATECIVEGGIWLPPWADPEDIEEYLMRTQRREDLPHNEVKTGEVLGKDGAP